MPDDDKALVFTQYPGFDRLVPHLDERLGRDVGFFHGGLARAQRDELVASFSDPDGPSVLVISIRAGGRGLNLPAANHVFHFDRWWNPAVEQQATDRAYRFGQRKDVFVTASSAPRRSRSGSTSCSTRSASSPRRSSPAAPTTGSASSTSTRSAPPSHSPTQAVEEAA